MNLTAAPELNPNELLPPELAKKRGKSVLKPETSSLPGILVYGGKNYAVGLLWFTVQEDTGKDLLKRRLEKSHADFYCLRTHISQQQGFGWLQKGHKRGLPVAAATIADQLVGEWHGVFEAENGWWYVQVRSDTITPNGDRFYTSEEEAYQVFQDEAQKNVWPHSYAPDKWRLTDTNTRELKLGVILDGPPSSILQPANMTASFGSAGLRNIVLGGVVAVVAIMMIIVMMSLFGSEEEITIPESTTPHQAMQIKPALKAPVVKIEEIVSPQQLVMQCGDAAANLYQAFAGWKTDTFTCAPGKASLTWQQQSGSLGDAKDQGLSVWPKGTSVTYNNRVMTANATLGNLPTVEPGELVSQEIALLYLEQNMQPLGALQVKPVIPPPPAPPPPSNNMIPNAPPPPPAPIIPPYLEIEFKTGFGPDKIIPLLGAPALQITKLVWNVPQGVWQYNLKWTYGVPNAASATPGVNTAPVSGAVTPVTTNPAGAVANAAAGGSGSVAGMAKDFNAEKLAVQNEAIGNTKNNAAGNAVTGNENSSTNTLTPITPVPATVAPVNPNTNPNALIGGQP